MARAPSGYATDNHKLLVILNKNSYKFVLKMYQMHWLPCRPLITERGREERKRRAGGREGKRADGWMHLHSTYMRNVAQMLKCLSLS